MTCMSPLPILHPHESDREVIFDGVADNPPKTPLYSSSVASLVGCPVIDASRLSGQLSFFCFQLIVPSFNSSSASILPPTTPVGSSLIVLSTKLMARVIGGKPGMNEGDMYLR